MRHAPTQSSTEDFGLLGHKTLLEFNKVGLQVKALPACRIENPVGLLIAALKDWVWTLLI